MIIMEDFTELREGTHVPSEGAVGRCPRCGRNGVRRFRHDGTTRFVHVQSMHMLGDGMRVEPADCCTMPGLAGAA